MENKYSKTKIGALLIGGGAILGTLGGWLSGTIDTVLAIEALIVEVGAIYLIFGVRGWPIINRTK